MALDDDDKDNESTASDRSVRSTSSDSVVILLSSDDEEEEEHKEENNKEACTILSSDEEEDDDNNNNNNDDDDDDEKQSSSSSPAPPAVIERPCPRSKKRIQVEYGEKEAKRIKEDSDEDDDDDQRDEIAFVEVQESKKEKEEDEEVTLVDLSLNTTEEEKGVGEEETPSSSSSSSAAKNGNVVGNLYGRCRQCHQRLGVVTRRPVPPVGALSEAFALKDPRLVVEGGDNNEKEYYHLTDFCVFDAENHLVQLEAGLIESNKKIFFCGAVNPICCADPRDPSSDTSVSVMKSGPIEEWWVTALQDVESSSPVIGITTDAAFYYLQFPHKMYQPLLKELYDKCILTKLVIETVGTTYDEAMALDYDDLVAKVSQDAPQAGLPMFSAEELLRNAEFVVNQIMSYEEAGDDDELSIMRAPCLQHLVSYAGLQGDFGKKDEPYKEEKKRRRGQAPQNNVASSARVSRVKPIVSNFSKATTTPLVQHVFKTFFPNQIKKNDDKKMKHVQNSDSDSKCVCPACLKRDCGTCTDCKTMVKFGGHGMWKATCLQRKCQQSNKPDIVDLIEDDDDFVHHRQKSFRTEFSDQLAEKDGLIYYKTVVLISDSSSSSVLSSKIKVDVGDFVLVRPPLVGTAFYVAQILYMMDGPTVETDTMAHVRYFARGADTVLGETADERELFSQEACEDLQFIDIVRKVLVSFFPTPDNWYLLGGTEDAIASVPVLHGEQYWFKFHYISKNARFESVDYHRDYEKVLDKAKLGNCPLCPIIGEEATKSTPKFVDFDAFSIHGEIFRIGDAMFLSPDSYEMPCDSRTDKTKSTKNTKSRTKVDQSIHTEYYRYQGSSIKGSNQRTPDPFHIGVLEKMTFDEEDAEKGDLVLKIRKIFRPENTSMDSQRSAMQDLNYVVWSNEFVEVRAQFVEGKCHLRPRQLLTMSLDEWHTTGKCRFYFDRVYDVKSGEMESLGQDVLERYKDKTRFPEDEGAYMTIRRPLRTLDVFAGCGGLSLGLEQSGVSRSLWAIENFPPAAEAFAKNHPDCTVLTEDCNLVLQNAMDEMKWNKKGQRIPLKGEVELLAGGPPCQGFSMLNNFTDREYSQFKNSLISTYLSYCEYYRPKYFILENVMNFACFKKNVVLKLCLRSLVLMGYQCTFGVLQAGSFGAPQTRRRCFLLAAAPDQVLPVYPEPDHVFSKIPLTVNVDEKSFGTNSRWVDSAPYRTVTVRDALSDLPAISNGASKEMLQYLLPPQSHFQRMVRGKTTTLYDHICRNLKPLIEARISFIPLDPGSDWRDLPNIEHTLSDGTRTEKMVYRYHDYMQPASWPKRGVCACAKGKHAKCDPSWMHPMNSLIPWSLPHTGRRHNNWSGQYGRLDWEGFFSTTVTNPEPMSKQGRVLHPEQHRVVSVRECARSQGFPDGYHFAGDVMEKHRQIGNAVPPPMALAIGRELMNVVKRN